MSRSTSIRIRPLSLLALAAALACGDSRPTAPDGGSDPLHNLVQVQSPDTTRGGGGGSGSPPALQGDGFFRGVVKGYSEADFPDTLKSAKPLANVTVTAYPAKLTDSDPKLGSPVATITTNATGEFTFPTLPGGLYVVTFMPPSGVEYQSAWTLATAHSQSGDWPWTIMLPMKR